MIKKLLATIAFSLTCGVAVAASGGYNLDRAPDRITDMASLQNGAKLFVNHCLGCHSANSMRYNKLTDIGLTEEQIKDNLLFTTDKIGDLMRIAMTPEDAKNWFGAAPPDLSVIARAKSTTMGPSGVDYVYTFLRTFYRDSSKATGWNNLVFPSVGMPNVLWQLQGPTTMDHLTIRQVAKDDGAKQWERTLTTFDPQGFSATKTEVLNGYTGKHIDQVSVKGENPRVNAVFDHQVADISNFLGWMAEPMQQQRKRMGVWVLLFLAIFLAVAWRLNAVYWKDVK